MRPPPRASRGSRWEKQVIAATGSHDIHIADLDGDGDLDLFGANWSGPFTPVEVWISGAKNGPGGLRIEWPRENRSGSRQVGEAADYAPADRTPKSSVRT